MAKKKKGTKSTTKANKNTTDEVFTRENVKTQRMDVPIAELRWDSETFSFRDNAKLTEAAIQTLADSIREAGVLLVPPLVKQIDGGYLVIDGHRRKLALETLAKDDAVDDWTGETLIPVNVITNNVSELELKLAAASANLDREELSQTERSRCAVSLRDSGAPKSEIMRRLGIKESQLERDLLVGDTPWVLEAIEAQVTGRISSVNPNLQQVAKPKLILSNSRFATEVRSRNLIVATPGYMLVGADIDQADLRVLADRIGSCQHDNEARIQQLYQRRWSRLGRVLAPYELIRLQSFNQNRRVQRPPAPPRFDPANASQLVTDFRNLSGDLYAQIASNVTGRTIRKSDPERGVFKTIILAQVNGQTPSGLTSALRCSKQQAEQYVARLFAAYPDVAGYLALLRHELVITGQVTTWRGRTRTVTAHRWMVDETRVRLLLVYRDKNHYWIDATPIRPQLRNLTCFLHRVWSVHDPRGPKSPRLIYEASRGRIGTRYYKQLDDPSLYRLPIRNLPWSRIRRVQKLDKKGEPVEEAKYEGFDATARSAINTVMQGGTADITVAMSLRCREIACRSHARLVMQIHDELIWEVPIDQRQAGFGSFVRVLVELQNELQRPPTPDFQVPITVSMKWGSRLGEMHEI